MAWQLMDPCAEGAGTELVRVYTEGVLVLARDPVAPWESREVLLIPEPARFADLMAARGLTPEREPCVLMINGLFYSRAEWPELWIRPGDRAALMWLPAGGGGKGSRIIAGVIMIIVGVIMMYFGNAYGANMVMAGAAMLAGGLLMPKLNVPTPDSANALAAPSPTYNLQAQGNYARLNQAIPVNYGRVRTFPDFAAAPWAEFSGNEQYLYQLFVIGQGEYEIEAVQIEDQLLAAELGADGIWRSNSPFEDISWQIIEPGGTVSYFPTRVLLSDAVAQQELLTGESIGPFKITDAEVNYIGLDMIASKGLYYANDEGGLDARGFSVQVYATKLKASGASWIVDGAEILLGTIAHSAATTTPQRVSVRYAVAEGRYQVRVLRTDAKDGSSRAGHDVHWVGLRGYVPGLQQYGNLTLLAMRAKATNQLSSQSSRKINVISTRKLPMWHPDTGWSLPQATRAIVWALADVLRNNQYGAGVPDDMLPLAEWYALERDVLKSSQADGDAFDYSFDRAMPTWEAISHISNAGRCLTYQRGPSYVTVRDQHRAVPVALFNMRNIERGSFRMSFALTDDNATDAVRVTYWDEQIWSYSSFDCVPPGCTAENPEEVTLAGVGRRAQAAKIGHHKARAKRHRRVYGSFRTELEGRLVKPGDLIAVSHDLPEWGQSAELVSFTGTGKASGNVLTLSEPLEWSEGEQHYIALARRNNSLSGPWRVIAGADPHQVQLAEAITDAALSMYTGGAAERTRVSFGPAERYASRCLVLPPLRMKGNAVEISFVEDAPEVYDETGAVAPAPDTSMQLPITVRPVVRNLFVSASGNTASPSLDLSWEASGNPSYYLVEISDNGEQYSRLAEPTTASCRIAVKNGPAWLRVAAVASIRGDWVEWSGNVATMMSRPANVTGLALKNPVAGQPAQFQDVEAVFTWADTARADAYRVEVWADGAKRSEHLRTDPGFTYTQALNRADGGPRRTFELRVWAVNSGSESAAAAVLAVSNPQMPATVVAGQQAGGMALLLTVPYQSAADYAGTRFVISQDAGANPASLATAADVPNWAATVPVGAAGTWYFWAANYDRFGSTGLNWSPRGQATVTATLSAQDVDQKIQTANAPVLDAIEDLDTALQIESQARNVATTALQAALTQTAGSNLLPDEYSTFPVLPPISVGGGAVSVDASAPAVLGELRLISTSAEVAALLTAANTAAARPNIFAAPGKYLVSFWARSVEATGSVQAHLINGSGGRYGSAAVAVTSTRQRYAVVVDASASALSNFYLRLDNDGGAGTTVALDGVMVEPQRGTITTPSPYVRGVRSAPAGGDNLLRNADFSDWNTSGGGYPNHYTLGVGGSGSGAATSRSQTTPPLDGRGCRVEMSASASTRYLDLTSANAHTMPAVPGEVMTASVYLRGTAGARAVTLYVMWYDGAGINLRNDTLAQWPMLSPDVPTRITSTSSPAPAGTVRARAIFRVFGTGSADAWWIEYACPQLERGSVASGWKLGLTTLAADTRATAAVVTQLQTDVAEIDGALTAQASSIQQVNARLETGGDIKEALVQVQSQAQATANNAASSYGVTLSVGGNASGLKALNDGSTSSLRFASDTIVMSPGGIHPEPYFEQTDGYTIDASGWVLVEGAEATALGFPRVAKLVSPAVRKHLWGPKRKLPSGRQGSLTLRAWGSGAAGATLSVTIRYYKADGVTTAGSDQTVSWAGAGASAKSVTATTHADAVYYQLIVYNAAAFTGTLYASNVQLLTAAGVDLIVQGSVTADKISVSTLSAISAYLGLITSAIIEMVSGTGWQYMRTASKWVNDTVNGWISAARPETGDYFQEFRAVSGNAIIVERKAGGPNFSGAQYYLLVRDSAGVDRLLIDPQTGNYKLRGHVEATSGSFEGDVIAETFRAQSAETGQRVVMTEAGVEVFDSNNVRRVRLGVW